MATAHRPSFRNDANYVPSTLQQTPSTPRTHSPQAPFSSHLNPEVAEHVVTPVAEFNVDKPHYVSPLDEPLPMSMPLASDVKDAGYLGGEKTLQIIENGRLACSKCDSADFRVLENIMLGEETQLRQYYSREWLMGCLPTGKSRLTVTDKRIIQEDLWGAATWMPTTCLLNRLSSAPHREIKFVMVQKAERKKGFYAFLAAAYVILALIIGAASGGWAVAFLVSIPIIGVVGPTLAGNCCMDWMVSLGVNQAGYGIFGLTGIKKSEAENIRAILHQAVEAESV